MPATPPEERPDGVALGVRDLRFTYPARRRQTARDALRGVSFVVGAGEAVAMLGPNGSGKSTLMKIVCGQLPAPGDTITVQGQTAARDRRRHLGVVFQSAALDPHLTVDENLRDQAALFGLARDEATAAIDETLARSDLVEHRRALVRTLSGGLRRRVDLCRALLHGPSLLLLDEPTVGLDPRARARFLADVDRRRTETGLAVLMSTHLMDEADRFDRVVLLHDGEIAADDAPARLRHGLGDRRLLVPDEGWQPPESATAWERTSGGWSRALGPDGEQEAALTADLARHGVPYTVAAPTLADVFEHLTGDRLDHAAPAADGDAP